MTGQNDPSDMLTWLQASNRAKQGDITQRTALGMIIGHVTRNAGANFLFTTCISKYANYAINNTNRMLNWVLPMSSINYVFTEKMAGTQLGKDLGVEAAQIYKDLRQAIIADSCKMSAAAMAALLASMLLTPPDDEKKWLNYQEWMIGPWRIAEEWWLQDLLGPALPLAATIGSIVHGKPNMSILFKGLANVCWNNPALRIADMGELVLTAFTNPEETFVSDQGYIDSPEGVDAAAVLSGNTLSFGLSWVSQFITPSFLKEFYRDIQQWETSYKRVENKDGELERTTYIDQRIRQVTRYNPVLGFLANIVTGANTGYLAGDMPKTEYYDESQIETLNNFSLFNEDWSLKTKAEMDQILGTVLYVLDDYDDMNLLYETGFVLSKETRAYISQELSNVRQALVNDFNAMRDETLWSWQAFGDTYDEGMAKVNDIKQAFYDQKDYIEGLYSKLWSDELMQGLVTYNRYNTTYLEDSEGDWYASGFHPTVLPNPLPLSFAPTEGNLGYEGDWVTESELVPGTKAITQGRALVPTETQYERRVGIDEWQPNQSASATNNGQSIASNANKGYTPYRYSGGSGGGGGGYTPSIYSRVPNVYSQTPRTMNADRLYGTQFDYLRPSFETKGSRESYKREDF
jgi:hypothetical protein